MLRRLLSCTWTRAVPLGMALVILWGAAWTASTDAQTVPYPQLTEKILFEIPKTDSIAVFDFESKRIIRRIDLDAVPNPPEDTPGEPGRYVYWIGHHGNALSVIDTADYRVVGQIPLKAKGPGNVTMARDGRTLYIPHYQEKALTVFKPRDRTQRVIPLTGFPGDVAIAPHGTLLVTSWDSNELLAVDEATGKIQSIAVGRSPVGVAVTPDGTQAYVSHDTEAVVEAIDLTTVPFRIAKRIQVKAAGGSVVEAGPDGKHVYVAHCCANSALTVISVETMSVKCNLALAPGAMDPVRIIFSPSGDKAYVLNSGSMLLSSFRPPCGQPVNEKLPDPRVPALP